MAKEQASTDVVLSIQVPIKATSLDYLSKNAGDKTVQEKLAGYIRWFIDRVARGGLMMEPEDMDYLAKLNEGKRFETSKDVVNAVEVALKRDEGQYAFHIKVDPTLVAPLEETAKWQGITGEQLLNMIVNQVMVNNWCYEFVPANGRIVPMDEDQMVTCQRVLGKDYDGAAIAKALRRLEAFEKKEAAQAKAA